MRESTINNLPEITYAKMYNNVTNQNLDMRECRRLSQLFITQECEKIQELTNKNSGMQECRRM